MKKNPAHAVAQNRDSGLLISVEFPYYPREAGRRSSRNRSCAIDAAGCLAGLAQYYLIYDNPSRCRNMVSQSNPRKPTGYLVQLGLLVILVNIGPIDLRGARSFFTATFLMLTGSDFEKLNPSAFNTLTWISGEKWERQQETDPANLCRFKLNSRC